jgi:hypothetical protein
MKNRLLVRNPSEDELATAGDVFVYCVGFERRSRFFAESWNSDGVKVIAVAYSHGRILSFDENRSFAESRNFKIVGDESGRVELEIRVSLEEVRGRGSGATVTVDVSAMDRTMMARILIACLESLLPDEKLKIVYAPAEYRQPSLDLLPIRKAGAVHPNLAGEVRGPDVGRSLLLGLGYEYGVSLHVLDTHEPDISFIFRPIGFDKRFAVSVEQANFGFDFGERNYEIVDYYLSDIAGLYDDLSSLTVAMKHETSIVGVPLGPKILSATMIVVGIVHQPRVSVLRYSLANTDHHQDVNAAGTMTGIIITPLKAV